MQTLEFKVSKRDTLGKKNTKALRREGLVPCVLYGGEENIHFKISAKEMRKLTDTPKTFLANLDIDGTKYNAFLQDAQYHPVTDEAQHFDFIQIFEDKAIKIDLPVKIVGFAEGVKIGGILIKEKRYVKVLALAKNLPEDLEIDVTSLKIGDSVKVLDLEIEGLQFIDEPSASIVAVKVTRVVEEKEEGEGEEEEGEEGAEAEAKTETETKK